MTHTGDKVKFVYIRKSADLPVHPDGGTIYVSEALRSVYVGDKKVADITDFDQLADTPAYHNSLYRGKYLGNLITDTQYQEIHNGTFHDMYIGDYWELYEEEGETPYTIRIVGFDRYYGFGDVPCTVHHVTCMLETAIGSTLYYRIGQTTLSYTDSEARAYCEHTVLPIIQDCIGLDGGVLSHRNLLVNYVDAQGNAGITWYDSRIELPTFENLYGYDSSKCPSTLSNVDATQLPLFAFNKSMIVKGSAYWLRNISDASHPYYVDQQGSCRYDENNSRLADVTPIFSICRS